MVVHAADGLDEISLTATTEIAELKDGTVTRYSITPADFDLAPCEPADLAAADLASSLELFRAALDGSHGAASRIVQLNAGAAIYVAGLENDLAAGVRRAGEVIASGDAVARLQQLIELSHEL